MTDEEIQKIKELFYAQLKEKDKEIERLKQENIIILKTALKQAEKYAELSKKEDTLKKRKV